MTSAGRCAVQRPSRWGFGNPQCQPRDLPLETFAPNNTSWVVTLTGVLIKLSSSQSSECFWTLVWSREFQAFTWQGRELYTILPITSPPFLPCGKFGLLPGQFGIHATEKHFFLMYVRSVLNYHPYHPARRASMRHEG